MNERPTNAPDLPSIKIIHRVLGTAADGDDADTSPDLTAIAGLRVRFTPLVKVAVWTGAHGPVTHAPIPVEGGYDSQGMLRLALADGSQAEWLLLDGQQRLTSLTQALTGSGVVKTMDARIMDLVAGTGRPG